MSELDVLSTVPETVTLASGTVVSLEDLKTRQFFRLLRILTRPSTPLLLEKGTELFSLMQTDEAAFQSNLIALLFLCFPEAESETIDFVSSMVRPTGLIDRPVLDKASRQHNSDLWDELSKEFVNPEIEDMITVIEAVFKRETKDIIALGKRLGAMLKVAQKTGQL